MPNLIFFHGAIPSWLNNEYKRKYSLFRIGGEIVHMFLSI